MHRGTFLQQPGCPPGYGSEAFATTLGKRGGCEGLTAPAVCGNLTGGRYWPMFPNLSFFAVSWDTTRLLQIHSWCWEENECAAPELIFLVGGDSLSGYLSAITSLIAFSQCFSLQRALLIQQLENDAGYLGLGCCKLPQKNIHIGCNSSAYIVQGFLVMSAGAAPNQSYCLPKAQAYKAS